MKTAWRVLRAHGNTGAVRHWICRCHDSHDSTSIAFGVASTSN
ncbi:MULTISPECIES: hypothetical protein [Paenibacillus]|nr:hypothetical protein [Paenibacillus odorifer]